MLGISFSFSLWAFFVIVVVVYLIGHLFHLFICAWNKIWCSSALYFQFYFYLHSYDIISFSPRINTDVAQYCRLEFFPLVICALHAFRFGLYHIAYNHIMSVWYIFIYFISGFCDCYVLRCVFSSHANCSMARCYKLIIIWHHFYWARFNLGLILSTHRTKSSGWYVQCFANTPRIRVHRYFHLHYVLMSYTRASQMNPIYNNEWKNTTIE